MKSNGLKILLIEPDKKQSNVLIKILMELEYQVILSKNVEDAIKKLLEFTPNLIICQNDLKEYSGFHFYNVLHNEMMKIQLPFILLINEFSRDILSVGIELGIDSFIFPPFENVKIRNILHKQLQKSEKFQSDTISQFRSVFDDTPFGIFTLKNKKIVDANPTFYNLVEKDNIKIKDFTLTELFNFKSGYSNELKLLRCLNGVALRSSFKAVPLIFNSKKKFNIYLSFIENRATSYKMIGLIIPDEPVLFQNDSPLNARIKASNKSIEIVETDRVHDEFFTNREKQVLRLSAQGAAVKQIAARLGISARTVEKHRSNIIRKTKTANITEAVFYANKKQLIEVDV